MYNTKRPVKRPVDPEYGLIDIYMTKHLYN